MKEALHVVEFDHPLGRSLVAATGRGVRLVVLAARTCDPAAIAARDGLELREGGRGPASAGARQILEYFEARRRRFTVGIDLRGTAFQLEVWRALLRVPFGRIVTYGWIAARIGRASASRAVGAACGANPVPVLVPCHRVVASSGIGGFGGGLEMKRGMLAIEGWGSSPTSRRR